MRENDDKIKLANVEAQEGVKSKHSTTSVELRFMLALMRTKALQTSAVLSRNRELEKKSLRV